MSQHQQLRYSLILILGLAAWGTTSEGHRSGCHRGHACPSDRGTYVCADLGHCAQCPDHVFCRGGQPRTAATPPTKLPAPAPAKPAAPVPAQPPLQVTKVIRVIDGDTLRLSTGEEVRLIGVDTPQTKHPRKPVELFGQEAAAFTKQTVEG